MSSEPIDPGVVEPAGPVPLLVAAGADPHAGGPGARAIAAFFGLPAMAELLDGR